MTIYRIENPTLELGFYGPYNNCYQRTEHIERMFHEHANMNTHPNASSDHCGNNYRFTGPDTIRVIACPSFELLKTWFKGYIGHLAIHGFKCYAIKIPRKAVKLSRSGKQCGYLPDAVLSRKRISFVTGKPIN